MSKRITITLSDGQLDILERIATQFYRGQKQLSEAGKIRLVIALAGQVTDDIRHGGKRSGAGRKQKDEAGT